MIRTWTEPNPDWTYRMIDEKWAKNFVAEHYSAYPHIQQVFEHVDIPVVKVDILRFLVLHIHGGLYIDLDVECMRPIEEWGLKNMSENVEIVIGIEYDNFDEIDRPGWPDKLQFVNWSVLARKNSNILLKIALALTENAYQAMVSERHRGRSLAFEDSTILDTTGPRAFTRALLKILSDEQGDQVIYKQLSMLDAPKELGQVCFLPVTSFACEQPHSRSGRWNDPAVLLMHHYHHTWKKCTTSTSCLYSRCVKERQRML